MTFTRGEVWAANIPGGPDEEKYYLVVSNNQRNRALGTALAARITSSNKPDLESIVTIPAKECVEGRVLCDDIYELWEEDARAKLGALSPRVMDLVNPALMAAFAIPGQISQPQSTSVTVAKEPETAGR